VWCLLALAGVLLAGCKVQANVDVTLHRDGSGVVSTTMTLDRDAVVRAGGTTSSLSSALPISDLRTAGWTISPWKTAVDGSATITVAHTFTDVQDLARRLQDLTGPNGILRDPHISRDRGWLSSRDTLSLVVDMKSPSPAVLNDSALVARLKAAGVDPNALNAELAAQLRTSLDLTVTVHLPNGHSKSYEAAPGAVQTFSVSHGGGDWDRIVKLGIALAFALLAGAFVLAAFMSARRDRRRRSARIQTTGIDHERAPLM